MKYKAYQIDAEHQESPLFLCDEFFPDNIAVFGNSDYIERCPEVFKRVCYVLSDGELADVLEHHSEWEKWYKNITEAIIEYLPPETPEKSRYSTQDIGSLKKLILQYTRCKNCEKDSVLCAVLTIVTGKKWNCRTIRGCCQSEWNCIYYPSDEWTEKALEYFEIEYFNTGEEWRIEDEEGNEEFVYTHEWKDDEKKREISENIGANPEDIKLYYFDGWTQTAKYRMED